MNAARNTMRLASTSCAALALATLLAVPAQAQNGTNTGTSAQNGQAPSQTATTDAQTGLPAATAPQPQTEPVAADQAQPPAASSADAAIPAAGDVVVVGTRASLQSAIARKRNAGTVVDSIVADDIASFPDKNVGDSLARVTGVQLDRDFGEGTKVSIRGVEPDLNRVEINGVSQVSAGGARSGDFRELATELVKSIDVYKGYSVDLTEGGIGGTVSIETRKPLDLKKALGTLVFSEQHLDTQQNWKPRITGLIGTPHFLLDGLGVLLNVTYDDKVTRQDYISNTNWSRLADFDHSDQKTVADPAYANFNTYASCAGVGGPTAAGATTRRLACETQFFDWAPTVPRYRNLVRDDKRISGDFTVQYEVANNFRAFAEATVNIRDTQLYDANYSLDMSRFNRYNYDPTLPAGLNGGTSRPQITANTATVDANHVVTSYYTQDNNINLGGTVGNNGASGILSVQRRDFKERQNSQYYQTGFDWDLDRIHIKALASHAEARDLQSNRLVQIIASVPHVLVDRRNDLAIPAFIFPGTINPADYTIYSTPRNGLNGQPLANYGPTLNWRPIDTNNSENQLKLDVDWDVGLPLLKSIEYGGQLRKQSFENYMNGGTRLLTPPGPGQTTGVYQTAALVTYNTNINNTPGAPRIAARNAIAGTATYNLSQAEYVALLSQANGLTNGAPLFTGLKNAPDNVPGRLAIPQFNTAVLGQYYDLSGFDQDLTRFADGLPQIPAAQIDETIASGYLKFNLDTRVFDMRLTGNGGIRYTHTKDVGTGTNISRVTRLTATGSSETVTLGSQQLSLANTYTDWLPAFNLALEIQPNLVLRGNWAKNVARPKPTDLVPNINCLDDQTLGTLADTCTAGNPALVPYRVTQWEANLAWYPNRDTLLSLGYFKKSESSFVVPNVTRSGVDLFGDGLLYTVRQPVNGFGALLDGVEASAQTAFTFLPKPLDGLGASANFTYSRPIRTNLTNTATNQPLTEYPGLSKYTWNASVFYDKDWLNIRFNYNYRSDWLLTVVDANNGNNPIYRKHEGYLDGKVTFRFPQWHYSLFMEMQNINKEYSQTFIKGIGPVEIYYPGQRFFAGFQVKF